MAKEFCKNENNTPIILCGDFNSQPKSSVHQYLTTGKVNAKSIAPWYVLSRRRPPSKTEKKIDHESPTEESNPEEEISSQLNELNISESTTSVRYILDYTLNRFCRWLRILGVDAALETEEEERQRTKEGNISIFQRCRDEGRALVTTSSKLLSRKGKTKNPSRIL
jgi:hypothetical protein